MSLVINTNVAALNAYNNLNSNQSKLENAFEQLSSGLRINSAADDASGLSIAQGLTSQINGMTQAVSNANDGINVAQIADGALGTVQDILQRERTLIVQAGNTGTQDSSSLGAIQQEVQNLNNQLNNIAGQTKFGQTNLLDGSYNKVFQVGPDGGDTIGLNLSGANVSSSNIANTGVNLNSLNIASTVVPAYDSTFNVAATGGTVTEATTDTLGNMFGSSVATSDLKIGNEVTTSSGGTWQVQASDGITPLGQISFDSDSGIYTVTDTGGKVLGEVDTATHNTSFDSSVLTSGVDYSSSAAADSFQKFLDSAGGDTLATTQSYTFSGNATDGWTVTNGAGTVNGFLTVSNGVYAFHQNGTDATTSAASDPVTGYFSSNAEVTGANGGIANYSSAEAASDLAKLDEAISGISSARSGIGAVQNQLSYTVSNLQTAITNVTASKSNLTDADMATEVTTMTQQQILVQASTSVLAQANSAPQAILKLLQ